MLLALPAFADRPLFTWHLFGDQFSDAKSAHAIDLHGDTEVDTVVVSANNNEIARWENDRHQRFTKFVAASEFEKAQSVYPVDLEPLGDAHIVATAKEDNEIAWWESHGNQQSTKDSIDAASSQAQAVYSTDPDGDADPDVLVEFPRRHETDPVSFSAGPAAAPSIPQEDTP